MHIYDVMTKNIAVIAAEATVSEASLKMKKRKMEALPVVDDGNILGLVTDQDIHARLTAEGLNPNTTKVGAMIVPGFFWCHEEQDTKDAEEIMRVNHLGRVVVLDHHDRITGIVSLNDLHTNLNTGSRN